MYIKDGSELGYNCRKEEAHNYSWGWLGNKVESSGWDNEDSKNEVIARLSNLKYEDLIGHTRGFHVCEICNECMGSATLKISHNGKIFSAPSNVVHYIEAHDYKPADIVVEAIKNGLYVTDNDWSIDWDRDAEYDEDKIDAKWASKIEEVLLKGMRGTIS